MGPGKSPRCFAIQKISALGLCRIRWLWGCVSPSQFLKVGWGLHSRLLRLRVELKLWISLLGRKQLAPGFVYSALIKLFHCGQGEIWTTSTKGGEQSYRKLAVREISRCYRFLYTQRKEQDGQVTPQATTPAKSWLPSGSNTRWGCGTEIANTLPQADRDAWATGVSVSASSGSVCLRRRGCLWRLRTEMTSFFLAFNHFIHSFNKLSAY